jgi:hypothetical protein
MNSFPGLLQAFFTDKLIAERQASANTLAAYRDTFILLLRPGPGDQAQAHPPVQAPDQRQGRALQPHNAR